MKDVRPSSKFFRRLAGHAQVALIVMRVVLVKLPHGAQRFCENPFGGAENARRRDLSIFRTLGMARPPRARRFWRVQVARS